MKWKRSKKAQQEAKQKEDCQKTKSFAPNSPASTKPSCLVSNKDCKDSRVKGTENLEIRVGFPINISKAIYPSHGNEFSEKTDGSNGSFSQPSAGTTFPNFEGKKSSLCFLEAKSNRKSDDDIMQSSEESLQGTDSKNKSEESEVAVAQINVKGQINPNKKFYVNMTDNACNEGLYRPYVV